MHHPSSSPRHRSHVNPYVPFAWEERPGVPKFAPDLQALHQQQLLVSFHVSAPDYRPLRIPPRLQHQPARSLSKAASFDIPSSRHRRSQLLHKNQSSDHPSYGCKKALTRKHSHGSLMSCSSRGAFRKEDDPFFMAIQVCQKEPIRVIYHDRGSKPSRCKEETDPRRSFHGNQDDFKHLTIRQLFTQQLEEDNNFHKAQKQPLIVDKRHSKGPFAFFAMCLGC